MFHLLSKLLQYATQPIVWVFVLLLVGLIFRKKKRGVRFLWSAFLVFYFFSNEFIFNTVNGWWEPELTKIETIEGKYPLGVVLGGYSAYAPKAKQVNLSDAADRFTIGLELYKNNKIKKLMFCGGHGELLPLTEPEGEYAPKFAMRLGVPKRDIIVEKESRNTWQNAVNCKRVLDSLGIDEPVLLITSTTHMPRSKRCFKKAGVSVVPVCVDGMTDVNRWTIDFLFIPDAYVLLSWNKTFHEWIGLAVYKIMGYN